VPGAPHLDSEMWEGCRASPPSLGQSNWIRSQLQRYYLSSSDDGWARPSIRLFDQPPRIRIPMHEGQFLGRPLVGEDVTRFLLLLLGRSGLKPRHYRPPQIWALAPGACSPPQLVYASANANISLQRICSSERSNNSRAGGKPGCCYLRVQRKVTKWRWPVC
jgi:hypothetical protein